MSGPDKGGADRTDLFVPLDNLFIEIGCFGGKWTSEDALFPGINALMHGGSQHFVG